MTISAQVQKNLCNRCTCVEVIIYMIIILHIYQAGIKNMHLCTFFQKTTNIYKHDSDDIKNQ